MIQIMVEMMIMKLNLKAGVDEMTGANKSNLSGLFDLHPPSDSKALTNKLKTRIYNILFKGSNQHLTSTMMIQIMVEMMIMKLNL